MRNAVKIATLCAALVAPSTLAPASCPVESLQGTLAIFVPYDKGMVAAVDSRTTFKNTYCDGVHKLLIPAHSPRTLVLVTGASGFLPEPGRVGDLCRYILSTPPLIDFGALVVGFLGPDDAMLGGTRFEALKTLLSDQLEQLLKRLPTLRARKGSLCQIVVANYDPDFTTSRLSSFVISIDATGAARANKGQQLYFLPTTPFRPRPFGEVDYLNQQVLEGVGRKFLSHGNFANAPPRAVSEVDLDAARSIADDVLQAAEKTAMIVAPPSGIGGPVDLVALTADADPKRLRWH